MFEIFSIISIGVALSMDAFSVSLGIGTNNLPEKTTLKIAGTVGIFHFFMPLIGLCIGDRIMRIFRLNANFLIAGILFLIVFEMIRGLMLKEEKPFKVTVLEIIVFAFSVSFDSFSMGIGLGFITKHILLSAIIFSLLSFVFTYLGLTIGKYSKKILGNIATIFGAIILIIVAIIHLVM